MLRHPILNLRRGYLEETIGHRLRPVYPGIRHALVETLQDRVICDPSRGATRRA